MFDYRGRPLPVLIEVKKKESNTLSWKPAYRDSLQRYANTLGLPLLVAWRHKGFWALFDTRCLRQTETNFNIRFAEALKQTLMGELGGDFSFSFKSGTGMHIKIRKYAETEDGFDGIIEDAYFTDAAGERFTHTPGVLPLFLCLEQQSSLVEGHSHVLQSFVIADSRNAAFAHRALVTLCSFGTDRISWRHLLEEGKPPKLLAGSLRVAARQAQTAGFLERVFSIRPAAMPDFLTGSPATIRSAQSAGEAPARN